MLRRSYVTSLVVAGASLTIPARRSAPAESAVPAVALAETEFGADASMGADLEVDGPKVRHLRPPASELLEVDEVPPSLARQTLTANAGPDQLPRVRAESPGESITISRPWETKDRE